MRRRGLAALALCLAASSGGAQEGVVAREGAAVPVESELRRTGSPVLTINSDRLFQQSLWGQRVLREIEAEAVALSEENARLLKEVEEEEQALTEQRAALSAAEFRPLADAFDAKVQRLRSVQDTKTRALGASVESAQLAFLEAARPVLAAIMNEAGAAVILEQRGVFVWTEAVDVTAPALARIDAELGSGEEASETPQPAPEE